MRGHHRQARGLTAVLCVALTLNAQFWIGGCGSPLGLLPSGPFLIELTGDQTLTAALAGSAFADVLAVQVDPAGRELRFVFPDDARQLSCKYAFADGGATITELYAMTAAGAVRMELNTSKHVTAITTSSGHAWRRPSDWIDSSADPETIGANPFDRANAQLLDLARELDRQSGPTTPSAPTDGETGTRAGTVTGGGTDTGGGGPEPTKVAPAAFGPLLAILGLMAAVFAVSMSLTGLLILVFDMIAVLSESVSTLLFASAGVVKVGEAPFSIAAEDLDGDGDRDLAVANYESRDVSVLLNNGDGTFAVAVNYEMGGRVTSVQAGDMDGDGDADLVMANTLPTGDPQTASNVSLLMNNGDGTFGPPVHWSLLGSCSPDAIVLVDLNGNARLDVAVVGYGGAADDRGQVVALLLSEGGGQFADPTSFRLGEAVEAGTGVAGAQLLAAGDLDGDGDNDLAVASHPLGIVTVLANRGDAVFPSAAAYGVAPLPLSLTAADLNGDGNLDLAVVSKLLAEGSGSNMSILTNAGDGTFAQEVRLPLSRSASCITAADLDGDGDTDLVVASNGIYWGANAVSILLNRGSGEFAPEQWAAVGELPSYAVVAADLDGDGDVDLAVPSSSAPDPGTGTVSVLLSQQIP